MFQGIPTGSGYHQMSSEGYFPGGTAVGALNWSSVFVPVRGQKM
jgi:hypothetical protein